MYDFFRYAPGAEEDNSSSSNRVLERGSRNLDVGGVGAGAIGGANAALYDEIDDILGDSDAIIPASSGGDRKEEDKYDPLGANDDDCMSDPWSLADAMPSSSGERDEDEYDPWGAVDDHRVSDPLWGALKFSSDKDEVGEEPSSLSDAKNQTTKRDDVAASPVPPKATTLNDLINADNANTMFSTITAGVAAGGVNFFNMDHMVVEKNENHRSGPDTTTTDVSAANSVAGSSAAASIACANRSSARDDYTEPPPDQYDAERHDARPNLPATASDDTAAAVGTDYTINNASTLITSVFHLDDDNELFLARSVDVDVPVPYVSNFSLLDSIQTDNDPSSEKIPPHELQSSLSFPPPDDNDGGGNRLGQNYNPFVPLRIVERLLSGNTQQLGNDADDDSDADYDDKYDPIVDFLKDASGSSQSNVSSLLAYLQGKDLEVGPSSAEGQPGGVQSPQNSSVSEGGIDPNNALLDTDSSLGSAVMHRWAQIQIICKCKYLLAFLSGSDPSGDGARRRRMEEWARRGDSTIVRYYREYGGVGFVVFTLFFMTCLWQFYFQGYTEDF